MRNSRVSGIVRKELLILDTWTHDLWIYFGVCILYLLKAIVVVYYRLLANWACSFLYFWIVFKLICSIDACSWIWMVIHRDVERLAIIVPFEWFVLLGLFFTLSVKLLKLLKISAQFIWKVVWVKLNWLLLRYLLLALSVLIKLLVWIGTDTCIQFSIFIISGIWTTGIHKYLWRIRWTDFTTSAMAFLNLLLLLSDVAGFVLMIWQMIHICVQFLKFWDWLLFDFSFQTAVEQLLFVKPNVTCWCLQLALLLSGISTHLISIQFAQPFIRRPKFFNFEILFPLLSALAIRQVFISVILAWRRRIIHIIHTFRFYNFKI